MEPRYPARTPCSFTFVPVKSDPSTFALILRQFTYLSAFQRNNFGEFCSTEHGIVGLNPVQCSVEEVHTVAMCVREVLPGFPVLSVIDRTFQSPYAGAGRVGHLDEYVRYVEFLEHVVDEK